MNWRNFDIEFKHELDEIESVFRCKGSYRLGRRENTRHFPGYPADPTEVEINMMWKDSVHQTFEQIEEIQKDYDFYERVVKEVEDQHKMMVWDFIMEDAPYAAIGKDID